MESKKAPAMLEASRSVATANPTSFCRYSIAQFSCKSKQMFDFFGGKFYGQKRSNMEKHRGISGNICN